MKFDNFILLLESKAKLEYLLKRYTPEIESFNIETEQAEDVLKMIIKGDPTSKSDQWNVFKVGKYSEWMIRIIIKDVKRSMGGDEYADPNPTRARRDLSNAVYEDLSKTTEDLELYDKHKDKFPLYKDINKIGSFLMLSSIVDKVKVDERDSIKVGKDEYEKILENSEWLVVIPKTEKASCKYGAGTRWCTAAKNNNYFDEYNKDGSLYIIIDKKKNEKWQFHYNYEAASVDFMDQADEPVAGNPIPDEILIEVLRSVLNNRLEYSVFSNMIIITGTAEWDMFYAIRQNSFFLFENEIYKSIKTKNDLSEYIRQVMEFEKPNNPLTQKLFKKIWDIELEVEGNWVKHNGEELWMISVIVMLERGVKDIDEIASVMMK